MISKETIEIVKRYVCKYTCACMADRLGEMESEQKEAITWMNNQKKEHNISNEDIKEALKIIEKESKENGEACCYNTVVYEN